MTSALLVPSPQENHGVISSSIHQKLNAPFLCLSATLMFAQTHPCDITETILCCWEAANPSKAKGEN